MRVVECDEECRQHADAENAPPLQVTLHTIRHIPGICDHTFEGDAVDIDRLNLDAIRLDRVGIAWITHGSCPDDGKPEFSGEIAVQDKSLRTCIEYEKRRTLPVDHGFDRRSWRSGIEGQRHLR